MTGIWKRGLSLFLAMVMVIGMVPMQTFATEEVIEEEIIVEEEEIPEEDSAGQTGGSEDFDAGEGDSEAGLSGAETPGEAGGNSLTEEVIPEEEIIEKPEVEEVIPEEEIIEEPEVEEETEADAAVAAVQAMIDALPGAEEFDTSLYSSQEEYEAALADLEAELLAIMEAGDTLPEDAELDIAKFIAGWEILNGYYMSMIPMLAEVSVSAGGTAPVEKKDSTTVNVSDLKNSQFSPPKSFIGTDYLDAGIRYKIKDSSDGWTNKASGTLTLTHNTTYEIQEVYTAVIKTQYSSSYYVTFKEYHEVTASVDSTANAEGAGDVTATGKVYHNEEATVTVTDVDGYKAELYNKGTKVAELSDTAGWTYTIDKATASVAYTVKYISEAETEYSVTVDCENSDGTEPVWGSATLGKNTGIKNDEIALTISPKGVTGNVMYTYEVAVTNGSYDATSGEVTVAGTGDVAVTVTFSEDKLELKENPQIEVDGSNKDTILDGLKNKILTASIQGYAGNADDYKVSVWLDIGWEVALPSWLGGFKLPDWVDLDNSGVLNWVSEQVDKLGGSFWLAPGVTLDVQIVDQYGRIVEPDVVALDSRWTTSIVWNPNGGTWNDGTTDNKTSDNVRFNTTVSAPGTVTKEHYTFNKWSPDPSKKIEQAEITYTAQWTPVNYTVSWDTNGDGTVDVTKDYPYGTTADKITVPATAKTEDAQYTYTPNGWDKEIAAVTGNVTYTAQFTPVLRSYTVTYKNEGENGAVLDTQTEVFYGTVPVYAGETTEAELAAAKNDAQYTWSFAGWVADANVDEDGKITGNVTYTATYTNITNTYTVTYKNDNGDVLETQTEVEYGTAPTYGGKATAELAEDKYTAEFTYTFKEWVADANVDENGKITGNVTYTASYTATKNQYTVTLKDMDGNVIGAPVSYDYGTEITPEGPAVPDGYDVFAGWYNETTTNVAFTHTVTGDLVLVARFTNRVAKIGNEFYESLADAYADAEDGDTIELLKDATMNGKLAIAKKITIEGNNHKIIANHTAFILETSADCELRNVTLDTNNKAKGVKIASGNVVFDNVTIPNSNKSDAITVNGTLTLKTYFNAASSYTLIDARSGVVNAEPGAVFDLSSWRCNVSPAKSDLKGAVGTDGELFFEAYSGTTYIKDLNSYTSSLNNVTLLKGTELKNGKTVSDVTMDLNGQTLTIPEGKVLTVNGDLVLKNGGTVVGSLILNNADATITGPEGLNVNANGDLAALTYEVRYADGVYSLYLPMPKAQIIPIKSNLKDEDPDLTFALNFQIEGMDTFTQDYIEALMAEYGDWYTDYELTITGLTEESVTFNANEGEGVDGYLGGQYDAWSENWVTVPFSDVTVKNGESIRIMETAASMMGQSGLRFTLAEIATIVADFDCGVYFTPEFLEANPNMEVTLQLKVFAEEEEHGFDALIDVATNEFENNIVAIIAADDKQTQYFTTLADAFAAEGTVTLIKDVGDATVEGNVVIDPNDQNVGTLTLSEGATISGPEGLNVVSGVEGLNVIYVGGVYSLAVDTNSNNVPDGEETITIKVIKAIAEGEKVDGVAITGAKLVEGETYVYDSSVENPAVTIKATPVVENKISKTYVKAIGEAELSYNNYVATANVEVKNGDVITVEFAKAEFDLKDERLMNYHDKMTEIANDDLFNTVVDTPDLGEGVEYTVTYKAREPMTHTVSIDSLDINDTLKWILKTVTQKDAFTFDMDELWLEVDLENSAELNAKINSAISLEDSVKQNLSSEKLGEVLTAFKAGGFSAAWNKLQEILGAVTKDATYYGAHVFGYNNTDAETVTEVIKVTYKSSAMYIEGITDVTLKDLRKTSYMIGQNVSVVYKDYTDEELAAAIGIYVAEDAEGASKVENVAITCEKITMEGANVSDTAYEVTYKFDGDETYKPCKATFAVTVKKAAAKLDLPDLTIEYGTEYDPIEQATVTLGNKFGERKEITNSLIQFLIGLDVAELDVDIDAEDAEKLTGLNSRVQLIIPEDILGVLNNLIPEDGIDMSLSDLMKYLEPLDDSSIDALKQALEAISGITATGDVTINLNGQYPEDIGAYLYGAVSVNPNYETAFDIGYILIKPVTEQVYLDWNYHADNFVMTQKLLQDKTMLGATAYVDPEFSAVHETANGLVQNVFFGIDARGNVVATLDGADLSDKSMENGAYTQLAFVVELANTSYYAVPLARAFVVVPELYTVTLVGEEPVSNREMLKTFDGEEKGFSVIVTDENGEVVYSDHYQNIVPLKENAQIAVRYTGVQTNGKVYNELAKPVHAGVYGVTALYVESTGETAVDLESLNWDTLDKEDLYAILDTMAVGLDVGLLVIEPSESTITMEDVVVKDFKFEGYNIGEVMNVTATSVSGLPEKITDPDYTVISASIASTNDFTVNGWDAVTGNVNIDFPEWLDEILPESVADGMTAAELKEKLLALNVSGKLMELGATEEIANSLSNLTGNIVKALEQMPEDITLTFTDDLTVNAVGAYAVMAIVTDSDHYPSADAGVLVITPVAEQVYLKWNYEDENFIWTRDLLDDVDLLAKAYNDKDYTEVNEDATAKITYQFIGVDKTGELKVYNNADKLPNGAYVELAYIELEVNGEMTFSDLIARPVVVFASNCNVEIGNVETVFDNTAHAVNVTVKDNEGNVLDTENGELTVLYAGLQTNGKAYLETENAPKHAGVYEALVTYTEYDENGDLRYYGANAGYVMIDLTQAAIDVTGGTVTYDGKEHAATVTAASTASKVKPDVTVITGTANIDANVDELGIDAITGNINIDFPRWLDAAMAEGDYEFAEGVNKDYLIRFINAYRQQLLSLLPAEELAALGVDQDKIDAMLDRANAAIDEILPILNKLPENVNITFEDNVQFTEPGAYVYYAMITDSDHYPVVRKGEEFVPVADTGLLIIEKADMVFDLLDTEVTYDGEGHFVEENNELNADYVSLIIDRENNTANILIDEDAQFVINALAEILGVEFDGDVQMSTIMNEYNGAELAEAVITLIEKLEKIELSEEIKKAMAAIKDQLQKLPENGTITVNGELPTEVGVYEVYAFSYAKYYKTQTTEAELIIHPVRVEVELADNSKYYGEDDPELTYTVKYYDHKGNELADAGVAAVDVKRVEGENVGEYAISATVELSNENYVLIAEPEDAVFTINPAVVAIDVEDASKVYGEDDPAEFKYNVTVSAGKVSAEELGITVARETGNGVGKYEIEATWNKSDNYNVIADLGVFEITKKPITVTAEDKTKVYGDEDPAFTVAIADADGKDITNALPYGDVINFALSREEGENAGEYVIKATTDGVANAICVENYDITYVFGKLTVTQRPIQITMKDDISIYGLEDPEFTYTIDGELVNGDTELLVEPTRNAGTNVGLYEITAIDNDPNYEVTVVPGTLQITGAYVDIVIHEKHMTYGDETPAFTAEANVKFGKLTEEEIHNILKILTLKAGTIDGTKWTNWTGDAGEYTITHTGDYMFMYNKNYAFNMNTGKLIVEKKAAAVKADDVACYEGDAFELTYTATGLVENDAEAVKLVIQDAEGKEVAKEDVVAGEYTIVPVVSENYDAAVENGKLTVTAKTEVTIAPEANKYTVDKGETPEIVITAKDGNKIADADGVAFTEVLKVGYVAIDVNGETVEDPENAVGTYTIKPTYDETVKGYDVTVVTGELEVLPLAAENVEQKEQYNTLQDAVDEANEGETIMLLKSGEIALVQKEVTILKNGKTAEVAALKGYVVEETTDAYIVKKVEDVEVTKYAPIAYIDMTANAAFDEGSETLQPLQDALYAAASGQTVRIIREVKNTDHNGTVIIPGGVTLNIGAYNLEATYMIGLKGSYVTNGASGAAGARLLVAKDNLVLSEVPYYRGNDVTPETVADRYVLPVWDSANENYAFANFKINDSGNNRGIRKMSDGSVEFQFKHATNGTINDMFEDALGADDNAVTFEAIVTWTTSTGVAYEHFVYNADFVGKVAGKVPNQSYDFLFKLTNYEQLTDLKLYAIIVTDSGAQISSTVFDIT